jgi:UDP-N-acetylglucosamine/UDP-N-acetylgalactosamine diphosphorylase
MVHKKVELDQDLLASLKKYDQEHLVKFFDELSEREKEHLVHDLKTINFEEVNTYFNRIKSSLEKVNQVEELFDDCMQPVPSNLKGSHAKSSNKELELFELDGLKAISQNKVAVLLLAGGQGTRLGVNYPKGMFSVDLLSKKTLYQLQAERLNRLKQYADEKFELEHDSKSSIPWYIMTSEHTKEMTRQFFEKHNYFNLNKDNVILFDQFMLPCLTREGKIILDEKHKVSKSPDGNGGLYKALFRHGILEDMKKRGVEYIHVYCVDNILVRMADPIFVGFCIEKNANCAAKVVKKTDPAEKVGVICQVNDRFQVVEYSEISEKTRSLRESDGELTYNAGNICNHFFRIDFLENVCK